MVLEAVSKFLATPDLLEKMFSLLDLESIVNLSRVLDKEVLKESMTTKIWNKLIRRKCPDKLQVSLYNWGDVKHETFLVLKNLATVLKLTEEHRQFLVDLVGLIIERFSATPPESHVEIVPPHFPDALKILPVGFFLLDEFEHALGSTEFRIQSIDVGLWTDSDLIATESFLLALSSRVSLQQEAVTKIRIRLIVIETEKGAQAFHTLMSSEATEIQLKRISIVGSIGEGGWEAFAKGLQLRPQQLLNIAVSKAGLAEGRREDIKTLWETFGQGNFLISPHICLDWADYLEVNKHGEGWAVLEKIMKMSDEEFAAEIERGKEVESDSEDEESDSEEEEESEEESESGVDSESECNSEEEESRDGDKNLINRATDWKAGYEQRSVNN